MGMDLKEEEILGAAIVDHWYYRSKGAALRSLLKGLPAGRLVDVGAGSGIFSKQLLEHGLAAEAYCIDPYYSEERDETHAGRPLSFRRVLEPSGRADLVLMMDVLEHVDDDLALLTQYSKDLASGARVAITVPAFTFLWSGHDVFLEHRRRYSLAELEDLVRRAGLEIERGRYFFGLIFPLVAVLRLLESRRVKRGDLQPASSLRKAPEPLNSLLVAAHALERIILFPINRMAGLTAFCLARKP